MKQLFVFAIFISLFHSCLADEPLFDAKVLPSIADKELDFWFYTPPDTGPIIPVAKKVYPNQTFMLLIFCRVHPVDSQSDVNITYDMQIKNPDDKLIDDVKESSYYKGPLVKNRLILSNDHVLEMSFEASDVVGTYQIQTTFYESISKRSFSTSAEIELVEFKKPKPFSSEEEFSDWIMTYYRQPDPVRSFSGILDFVKTEEDWIKESYMLLAFFRRIFHDNPFLWEYYSQLYEQSSNEGKEKMLLVAAVVPDNKEKKVYLKKIKGAMESLYKECSQVKIPSTDEKITTAVQLDILWMDFFASGTYEPVKKIVSALVLKEYDEICKKVKSGEIADMTEEIERKLMLGIAYQAAEWSLISNCMQSERVHKYCRMLYEHDTLEPDVRESLGVILAVVDMKKRGETTIDKQEAGRE
jgi:hypothetical protein